MAGLGDSLLLAWAFVRLPQTPDRLLAQIRSGVFRLLLNQLRDPIIALCWSLEMLEDDRRVATSPDALKRTG